MPRLPRAALIHFFLLLFALALVARAAQVQLWEGGEWRRRAERQHYAAADVPAPRGNVFDASGVPLAQSRELVQLSVAPKEAKDPRALTRALAAAGVPERLAARAAEGRKSWIALPGRYLPGDIARLAALRGVYTRPAHERSYTQRAATQRILGRVDAEGNGVDGLELALDSLLRGRSGRATLVRDARGARFEAPLEAAVSPRPGHDVVLTISQELQEISERALAQAVAHLGGSGGDVVILDPHSGEIRAMVSLRSDPRSTGSPALS